MLAALLLLLCGFCYGQDINATDVDVQDLMRQLEESRGELDEVKEALRTLSAPQVFTVQLDDELRNKLNLLQGRLETVDATLGQYQEKFTRLRDDLGAKIEDEGARVKKEVVSDVEDRMAVQTTAMKGHMDYTMNPVRMNLPNFGLWLMVTGLFMLIWGKKRGQ